MAIERVLFVYIAIQYAFTAELTVGMIFALQSYRQQFLDATTWLIQQAIGYRLLDMHLARISDIALSTPEPIANMPQLNVDTLEPKPNKLEPKAKRVELRDVRFRYGPNELQQCCMELISTFVLAKWWHLSALPEVEKRIFLKIMMGLLPPSHGEVLIDGAPLTNYGIGRWRREVSVL